MVGSNYEIVDENRIPISCGLLPLKNEDIKSMMNKEVIPVLYASVMVKRELVENTGLFRLFFDRKGYADIDWLNRCAEASKVTNTKQILYFYRRHHHSFTYNEKNSKNLILQNIHLLLQAHLLRVRGEKDFFELNDVKAMKNVICNYHIRRAENCYWEKNIKKAYSHLLIALGADCFNAKVYKVFFYVTRKSIS